MVTCAGLLIASRGQQGVCLGVTGCSSSHRLVCGASSSEPPTSVGLACHPVGACRRLLVKQLNSTRGGPAGDVRCAWAVSAQQCCTLGVVDDLEPLTDAERKLLEAVQTGGLCDLSQDDETDRTVRAAVLKAILSGEGEAWGIGAGAAINLLGAVVSGHLGGFDGSRLPPIRLQSCRFEDTVDFSNATFTGNASFSKATFTG